mmetsp:Transcript_6307/g.18309  ORF Transcript_6307/g.18309 Transcript_6307/m.18309 type:complete len:276 (+) Transcript_6307:470-1297(+)
MLRGRPFVADLAVCARDRRGPGHPSLQHHVPDARPSGCFGHRAQERPRCRGVLDCGAGQDVRFLPRLPVRRVQEVLRLLRRLYVRRHLGQGGAPRECDQLHQRQRRLLHVGRQRRRVSHSGGEEGLRLHERVDVRHSRVRGRNRRLPEGLHSLQRRPCPCVGRGCLLLHRRYGAARHVRGPSHERQATLDARRQAVHGLQDLRVGGQRGLWPVQGEPGPCEGVRPRPARAAARPVRQRAADCREDDEPDAHPAHPGHHALRLQGRQARRPREGEG